MAKDDGRVLLPFRLLQKPPAVDGGNGGGEDGDMDDRLSKIEAVLPTLATKSDLTELRLVTKADFAELRLASKADFADLRADVAAGRADIYKLMADNQRWTHTALVALFSTFVIGLGGLLFTIYNATKPPAQLTGQASTTSTASGTMQTGPALPPASKTP